MAHHKRKRSKKARAGCLLCKPQKMNGQRNGFAAQKPTGAARAHGRTGAATLRFWGFE